MGVRVFRARSARTLPPSAICSSGLRKRVKQDELRGAVPEDGSGSRQTVRHHYSQDGFSDHGSALTNYAACSWRPPKAAVRGP